MKKVVNKLRLIKERVLWGGRLRESLLQKLLLKYYKSKLYRDWGLSPEQPHFFDQRAGLFLVSFDKKVNGFYGFTRGFNASEIIMDGDVLLDIGCGDGFFTKRFFSVKCSQIDAIDIEPTAINAAKTYNNDKKINYILTDAVKTPFPKNNYNVIVWDGAIGHFAADTVHIMLEKISKALHDDGVFVGSESLGIEGADHLQYFATIDSLSSIFKPYFKYVALKSIKYEIPGNIIREEAYWKCSDTPGRIKLSDWKYF